jgi:hypothetical protein
MVGTMRVGAEFFEFVFLRWYGCCERQMQGSCLMPLDPEKQTAILSVLEDLMAAAGHVFSVQFERVRTQTACHGFSGV